MRFIRPVTTSRLLSGVVLALLSALLFAACSDEEDGGGLRGRTIGFEMTAPQGAEETGTKGAATRAAADTLPRVEITAIEGTTDEEGRQLYLHTLTEEDMAADDAREADAGVAGESGGATTKAAPVTTATMHADATVFAAVYPSTDTWNNTVAPNYFFDTQVKKSESWTTAYYWPGTNKRVAFFAYAPHHCAGVTLTTGIATPGAPAFSYTVPAAVADQTDLLTASSVDVAGVLHAPAPLTFRHALTAVRFETGNPLLPGTVTKITLKGVYGTATHRIGETAWSAYSGVRDFAQTLNVATPDPNVLGAPITQPAATFMMLPQTLPAGAQLEVVYIDKLTNTQRTLTASIAGKTWPMGKTVTYRISTNSIVVTPMLTVTPPADFEYTGGMKGYTVTSYLEVTRPGDPTKTVPAPWTVEYSTDNGLSWNGTKPAWLTEFTESGPGGNTPAAHQATAAAQTGIIDHPQNAALLAATPVNDGTNVNIYDLSTKGGTAVMRTANCYIVNAAGRYKLPLVYGNAVDYARVPGGPNPGWNTSAYTSQATGDVLSTFINHLGNPISNPYIYNNTDCTPHSCTLVWQDEPNLVTNVSLSSDHHFLEFTVGQSTIRQGNAVVAVRNSSNTVMWSWHIWVTNYVPGSGDKAITNHQYKQYPLMAVNIGWCDGQTITYTERTMQVRFKQTGTSVTPQIITVKQKAHTITKIGNSTYYQWGRKDPFVGAVFDNSTINNKTWYNETGAASTANPTLQNFAFGISCIASGIKQPNTFNNNSQMDNTYANLWSVNNAVYTANDDLVVKTIYDPSPVGYKLLPNNAFTGFTTTGQNTSNQAQFNVSGIWNNGWNFYCDSSNSGTVFFPASGWRDASSAVPDGIGVYGVYRTAAPHYTDKGWSLSINAVSVTPYSIGDRAGGFVVRPCQE